MLLGLLVSIGLAARWLLRDLRAHPPNFPSRYGVIPTTAPDGSVTTHEASVTEQSPWFAVEHKA